MKIRSLIASLLILFSHPLISKSPGTLNVPDAAKTLSKKPTIKLFPEQELLQAITKNDSQKAKSLLDSGLNPNTAIKGHGTRDCSDDDNYKECRYEEHFTCLHEAVTKAERIEIVELLLKYHADVNALDDEGSTPLHRAVLFGQSAILVVLLKHGAKVNVKNNEGNTPLHIAAHFGRYHIMRQLVDYGADINAKDKDGATVIHYLARLGNAPLLDTFIEKGGNINLQKKDGTSPLLFALQERYYAGKKIRSDKAVELLLLYRKIDVNAGNHNGTTPLHYVASRGWDYMTRLLINAGANLNTLDKQGRTPLHAASSHKNKTNISFKNVVQLLLESGAKVDIADINGLTALDEASARGHDHIVSMLLKKNTPNSGLCTHEGQCKNQSIDHKS